MKKFLLMVAMLAGTVALAAGPRGVAWRLPTYTLTARAMDVREALETFGVAEGVPFVLSQSVGGTFSGNFTDMPAGEFLDRLTTMHNLTWYYDGASVFVSGANETVSTLIDLRYMKSAELVTLLKELGVEDERFPIKTASNDELIMVSGPPRYVTLVAEMIAKADKLREQRTFAEVETRIFPLENTWADNVSFTANSPESTVMIQGVAYLLQQIMGMSDGRLVKEGTNDVSRVEASVVGVLQPVIRPENRLNAVVVRDAATRMPQYERLIRELDRPQKLVEIEVTTIEMSKNDALDWQASVRVTGGKDRVNAGVGQNAANLESISTLGGMGLAGAVSYLGRRVDVDASLSAMKSKGKLRNISRTTILTMNNLAASMTDNQSYHTRVVGREVATLEEVSAGTRLNVKPRIIVPPPELTNVTAMVWMSMELEDGGFESATVDSMPMTRRSTLETQAALPVEESLMMAGYFRDVQTEAGWGIPLLRDIPLIGWLFGGSVRSTETVQRMFILTPRVLDLAVPRPVLTQTARQRDLTDVEMVEENLNASDDSRELRDLERRRVRKLRREELKEQAEIREEEIEEEIKEHHKAYEARKEARKEAREAR